MKIEFELPAYVSGQVFGERVLASVKLDTDTSTLTLIVPTKDRYGYAAEEQFEFALTPKGKEAV